MPQGLILYVDDDANNRTVFLHAFQARFHVLCVGSGEEAMAILGEGEQLVSVLVTDQRMPGMSGNELLERVRVLHPEIVRVVITAYSDIEPILRAVNEGLVARYLVKPWDRAELERTLTWALEVAELTRRDRALQLRLLETERLATLGTIGSAVLHDLRNPLQTARLNADALLQRLAALEDPRTLASLLPFAEDLSAAIDLMTGIAREIDGFSTPARPSTDAAPTSADAITAIKYAISVCEHIAVTTGGRIVRDHPAELPRVEIEPAPLTQVLINLISNACRALDPGGTVIVSATTQGDSVCFRVKDDGRGMSEAALRRAGSPFFSTRERGTGLGLLQCHRLLGARGASLQLKSAPASGTTAEFSLRRSRA
jgi:two-component system, NtrC family, sensor kinase